MKSNNYEYLLEIKSKTVVFFKGYCQVILDLSEFCLDNYIFF